MSLPDGELLGFLDAQVIGALATRSGRGEVHQSPVYYARDGEELLISTLAGRRKALDVEETGWATLCVMGHEPPFPSLVLSGTASIRRTGIGPATARVMQRMLSLEDPPEPQTDAALAAVGRVILALHVDHVGPATHLPAS